MTCAKIHIVGIGANGIPSLNATTTHLVQSSPVVCGSARILSLYTASESQHIHTWVSPFIDNIAIIRTFLETHKTVVILATGDGNWFGPSNMLLQHFDNVQIHPHVGAFQHSASVLQWPLQDCTCTTVHGRDIHTLKTKLYHNARLLVLSHDKTTPVSLGNMLCHMGLENSTLHILNALGTPSQSVQTYQAKTVQNAISDLNTVAISCVGHTPSLSAGLPDDTYTHTGQITKSAVRAMTMAHLAPYPNAVLWDIGAGAGSISIEWCRLGGISHAIEKNERACDIIRKNAHHLGVSDRITVHNESVAHAPPYPRPDCIFIGGGITSLDMDTILHILPVGGRVVANVITVQGEHILYTLHAKWGGTLQKIAITKTAPTQRFERWDALAPVTQYVYIKQESSP